MKRLDVGCHGGAGNGPRLLVERMVSPAAVWLIRARPMMVPLSGRAVIMIV